jgi:gliding motility-associated lipoprotein GldH
MMHFSRLMLFRNQYAKPEIFRSNARAILTLCCFALLLFSSCDKNRLFEENQKINDYIWDVKDVKTFTVDVSDTISQNNFFINVRNSDSYAFSNLYIFIKTTFPNGRFSHDTVECILANQEGHWLGKGLGDIWDNQIPFKKAKRFPLKGKYTFQLEQGMRINRLPQIMDVGLRIETTIKN